MSAWNIKLSYRLDDPAPVTCLHKARVTDDFSGAPFRVGAGTITVECHLTKLIPVHFNLHFCKVCIFLQEKTKMKCKQLIY